MRPVWARKFEPPAISGGESQDVVEALLRIYHHTGEARFLRPIPSALLYLQRSELPDGRLARFYELQSNQPLYMNQEYELTYDDGDLPSHYSWKVRSKREQLQEQFDVVQRSEFVPSPPIEVSLDEALAIVGQQDEQGRWVSVASNERLVGQPKIQSGERYLSTTVFATNMALLSRFLEQSKIE
jgi:hypothetical protein